MATTFTPSTRIGWNSSFGALSIYHYVLSWVLTLSLVFFACRGTFSFLMAASGGITTSSLAAPARQMGVLGYVILPGIAYSIAMWAIVSHLKSVFLVAFQMKILTLLALLTIVSAIWSQDPIRTSYNGVFYLVCTLFAFYLFLRFPATEIMTLVMMTGALVCVLGVFLVVFFPNAGLSNFEVRTAGAWKGMFLDRTTAGKCLTFLLSPALVFGYRKVKFRHVAYIGLLLTSIVMARAVTAMFVVFAYALFMIGLRISRRLEYRTALLLGVTTFSVCLLVAYFAVPLAADLFAAFGRDLTLTGRTQVWSAIMPSMSQRPLLGYGFYAFWLGMSGESGNVIRAAHWFFGYAHNGMLEIVLQLGLVGLVIFLITFVNAVKDAATCYRERSMGVDWYIGLLFLTVLYNIDEATVVWPTDLLSILYIVACCGLSGTARRLKAESKLIAQTTSAYSYLINPQAI